MSTRFRTLLGLALGAFVLLAVSTAHVASAQTPRTLAAPAAMTKAMTMLPASDALMFVEVKRLLNDVMPRALAGNAAKLAEINAEIDKFRSQTGIDPRSFERVALSVKINQPRPQVTKAETVAIAQGTFNAGAMVAAGRLAAKGKYQEQPYKGKTIYVFSLNERVKLLGLFNARVSDVAIATLDAGTLAIGSPVTVRAAIDANAATAGAGARVSNEIIGLATRNPNAVVGFGGNLPVALTENIELGNPEISRHVASVRQFYGSVGTTATGFDMLTVLRTETPANAQSLGETLAALKQFAPLLAAQLPAPRGKIAQSLLDTLQITNQGNEVQLKLAVAQADLPVLMGSL